MSAQGNEAADRAALYLTLRRVADADRTWPGEGYAWEDGRPWPPKRADAERLWLLLAEAERAVRAARAVKARLEALMLADVQTRGPVRFGDDVYYPGRDATWRWADPDTSPAGLLRFIAQQEPADATREDVAAAIGRVVRVDPRAVRITGLRALADRAGIPAEAAVDTFLSREGEDTPTLSHHRTTLTTCPAWAKALGHGQRRAPRKAPEQKEPADG